MQIVVRRLTILSNLDGYRSPKMGIAVASPGAKAKDGDKRTIIWRSYLLAPADQLKSDELMIQADRFLATEAGYQLGAYLEAEIRLDSDFKEVEHKDMIVRETTKLLGEVLEKAVGLPKSTFEESSSSLSKLTGTSRPKV